MLNPWSNFDDAQLISDTPISHMSCWLLLIDEPDFAQTLQPLTTDDALPMEVRVRHQSNESTHRLYSNETLKSFMETISEQTGVELPSLKLKLIEETLTRRMDTQIYHKEDAALPVIQRRLNSLRDTKVVHNSIFLVEVKDPNEIQADIEIEKSNTAAVPDVELLDDTEDLRTVIVNTQAAKDDYHRF